MKSSKGQATKHITVKWSITSFGRLGIYLCTFFFNKFNLFTIQTLTLLMLLTMPCHSYITNNTNTYTTYVSLYYFMYFMYERTTHLSGFTMFSRCCNPPA